MTDRTNAPEGSRSAMTRVEGFGELVPIGDGGLGDVYRATRDATGEVVAIKILRDVSDHSVAWRRTRRELAALVALAGHRHVIQPHELLDLPDGPALVMEYAPGGSVADLVRRRGGTLDVGEVVLVGRHTATALVGAHARGIVHRDVKPQNLLIDASGQVRLCDFGVAALTRSEEFRTRTSALSMRYASPEDLDEEAEIGPPSDIYSLGATLLHLAHGAPPSLKERLTPWRPRDGTAPHLTELDAVLAACLQPDPTRRPTASEVLDRLDRLDRSLDDRRRSLADPDRPAPAPTPTSAGSSVIGGCPTDAPSEDGRVARPDRSTGADPDTTIPRDPRPPPHSPAPEPVRSGRRRWPLIAAPVAVITLAVVLWSIEHDSDGATAPATIAPTLAETSISAAVDGRLSIAPRPSGLVSIDDPAVVWPYGRPGDCLIQLAEVDQLADVACSEPHDLQRFVRATLDQFDTDLSYDPGTVTEAVRTACDRAFEPFVGVTADESALAVAFTQPSATTWADGDRQYQCFVGIPGARIEGDATGSGF